MYRLGKSAQLVTLFIIFVSRAAAQGSEPGRVEGSVYDYHEAVILGAKVTVFNDKVRKYALPDPDTGRFAFELPQGLYWITTDESWWFSVRRANFFVTSGKISVINLQPKLKVTSRFLVVDKHGERDIYETTPRPHLTKIFLFSH